MSVRARLIPWCLVSVLSVSGAWAQSGPGTGSSPGGAGIDFEQMTRIERQDLGVAPTRQLHGGALHGPTPAGIPGGQVVTTQGLVALMQGRQVPFLVIDVLGQPQTLPNAAPGAWLAQPGAFNDPIQRQAEQMLGQMTQGRKDVALVFYCLSRECWMSYNAALRAINAGYTNVLWYRGGIEAWQAAGLPLQQGAQGQQASAQQPGGWTQQPPPQEQQQQQRQQQQQPQPSWPGRSDGAGVFTPVQPMPPSQSRPPGQAPTELRIGQGRFFSFAMPQGWRIGEEGQYALTLVAPDNAAMTLMVGNAGMTNNYPPGRYAYDKLSAIRPQNLQIGQPRPARPAAGFSQAVEFDVSYLAGGVAQRGLAKVSMAPAYDSTTMAMTAAVTAATQWPQYATWLPLVADQVAATDGAAFGRRGVMQQNLQNSMAFGEAARQYRDWSQKNWQQVTDQRNESVDKRNFAVRENLGGVQTFSNPYGGVPPVELPMTNSYYWTDRQGRMVGTDDPSANPNVGSTGEWRRMERVNR